MSVRDCKIGERFRGGTVMYVCTAGEAQIFVCAFATNCGEPVFCVYDGNYMELFATTATRFVLWRPKSWSAPRTVVVALDVAIRAADAECAEVQKKMDERMSVRQSRDAQDELIGELSERLLALNELNMMQPNQR